MNKYFDYLAQTAITHVDGFAEIYNDYDYLGWLVVWFFWFLWFWLKMTMLTMPVWLPVKLATSNLVTATKNILKTKLMQK